MSKRAYSSTASERAATDSSILETSLFETNKEPKQNKKSSKKKKTDKVTSGQKIMTEFVTTKQNEIQPNRSETSCIEQRLDEINSKLSNVLTKNNTDIIRNIIKDVLEGLKEKLLGSVVKQIEIIESNLFDQAKELASLKEKLTEKDKEIEILKQSNESVKHNHEASINDLEQYGRRNSVRISGLSNDADKQTSTAVTEQTVRMIKQK